MRSQDAAVALAARRRRLIDGVAAAVPAMRRRAPALDREAQFPAGEVARLRRMGALAAPLPAALGGLGLGTEPAGGPALMQVLRLLGCGNLSVGRVFEAHVNALRLILRFGDDVAARQAAGDACGGHLFGLWVTDAPGEKLVLQADGSLRGAKMPCSAAGFATRALLTVRMPDGGTRMRVLRLGVGECVEAAPGDAHGMRAARSLRVCFDGVPAGTPVGGDGDYLREPDFSAGAWRGSAVALGGLEALVGEMRAFLLARQRAADPHQQARIGRALIAQETASLFVWRAACIAEAADGDAADAANTVNLARIAVETACLEAMQLVQRGIGMAAFRRGSLMELLLRDLAVYLRQPAPDAALAEAAAHFTARALPPLPQGCGDA